jgi:pectin methylesterase-like acyl-CoA thioesterase
MRRAVGTFGVLRAILATSAVAALSAVAAGLPAVASAQVLRVGTFNGIPGQFTSIQSAVNRAKPGDMILVGPGDYKTTAVHFPAGASNTPADILITTGGLTLRGMDRNAVTIDGTKAGSPLCSNAAGDQGYGPRSPPRPRAVRATARPARMTLRRGSTAS